MRTLIATLVAAIDLIALLACETPAGKTAGAPAMPRPVLSVPESLRLAVFGGHAPTPLPWPTERIDVAIVLTAPPADRPADFQYHVVLPHGRQVFSRLPVQRLTHDAVQVNLPSSSRKLIIKVTMSPRPTTEAEVAQKIPRLIRPPANPRATHLVVAVGDFGFTRADERQWQIIRRWIHPTWLAAHQLGCRQCAGSAFVADSRQEQFPALILLDKRLYDGELGWRVSRAGVSLLGTATDNSPGAGLMVVLESTARN